MDKEQDLIDAFESLVHKEFPNPEARIVQVAKCWLNSHDGRKISSFLACSRTFEIAPPASMS